MKGTVSPSGAAGEEFGEFVRPYRSMPPRTMAVTVICFSLLALTIGLSFFALGYWPILPFTGLELIALVVGFTVNWQHSKNYELIVIHGDRVMITQRQGKRLAAHQFQRYWTMVRGLPDTAGPHSEQLLIGSHGRFVAVGDALTGAARADLGRRIREALHRRCRH